MQDSLVLTEHCMSDVFWKVAGLETRQFPAQLLRYMCQIMRRWQSCKAEQVDVVSFIRFETVIEGTFQGEQVTYGSTLASESDCRPSTEPLWYSIFFEHDSGLDSFYRESGAMQPDSSGAPSA